MKFPRPVDKKGHAWGLEGAEPSFVWERYSSAYEGQLERIVRALEKNGFSVEVGGAGSEDGEYVHAFHPDGRSVFQHTEDPDEARKISEKDDNAFHEWISFLCRKR